MRQGLMRDFLLGFVAALWLPFAAQGQACGARTPADMEGPFYKAGAPVRMSLVEPGAKALKLMLSGVVYAPDCKPIAGAMLDFWQADERGDYDNAGFRYRGVVITDAQGRYRLETNLPPPYMGRPRHIHVRVQRPGAPALTTQLYFAGESRRENPALVLKTERAEGGLRAQFDFVY